MIFSIDQYNDSDIRNFSQDINVKGYTILKNTISKKFLKKMELEVIEKSWGNINNNSEVNIITTNEKCTLSSSHNLVSLVSSFNELYNDKSIRLIYEKLMNSKSNFEKEINSSYFFKRKESGSIKLHQDNAYFNLENGKDALTFYIPIHYQSKNRGTIFYYSGSHQMGDLVHVPEGNLGASMCIEKNKNLKILSNYKIDYLELYPGDIVLHNALVVHGTLPNPGDIMCEAFNFTLFGENNFINNYKLNKYKNKLAIFLKSKKGKSDY